MIKIVLSITLLILIMMSVVWISHMMPRQVRYDCTIAEIHVDYPVTVREECRRMLKSAVRDGQRRVK